MFLNYDILGLRIRLQNVNFSSSGIILPLFCSVTFEMLRDHSSIIILSKMRNEVHKSPHIDTNITATVIVLCLIWND